VTRRLWSTSPLGSLREGTAVGPTTIVDTMGTHGTARRVTAVGVVVEASLATAAGARVTDERASRVVGAGAMLEATVVVAAAAVVVVELLVAVVVAMATVVVVEVTLVVVVVVVVEVTLVVVVAVAVETGLLGPVTMAAVRTGVGPSFHVVARPLTTTTTATVTATVAVWAAAISQGVPRQMHSGRGEDDLRLVAVAVMVVPLWQSTPPRSQAAVGRMFAVHGDRPS
jgi:hypothetical protein